MQIIKKQIICRVGMDWHSGRVFISELRGLEDKIVKAICKDLKTNSQELHDKTCGVKKFRVKSITGDDYLAEKVLKFNIVVTVGKCELADDQEKPEE